MADDAVDVMTGCVAVSGVIRNEGDISLVSDKIEVCTFIYTEKLHNYCITRKESASVRLSTIWPPLHLDPSHVGSAANVLDEYKIQDTTTVYMREKL